MKLLTIAAVASVKSLSNNLTVHSRTTQIPTLYNQIIIVLCGNFIQKLELNRVSVKLNYGGKLCVACICMRVRAYLLFARPRPAFQVYWTGTL